MPSYVPLPAFRGGGGLDFGGLNDGLDFLIKQQEKNRLLQQSKDIGAAMYAPGQTGAPAPQAQNALLGSPQPRPSQAAQVQTGSLVDRITGVESGGNANATNPNSSATGLGQFTKGTWLDTIKQSRPDLATGKSDDELLSLRTDPNLSREMTGAYAASNGRTLTSGGYEATPGNTYLAHFAGPTGAMSVLRADPATPVNRLLTQQAVAANPFLANMTAGDLRGWADKKMSGGSPAAAPAQQAGPSASPAAPTAASGPNYDAAIAVAASQGNLPVVAQLTALKQQAQETARQTARDAQTSQLQDMQIQSGRAELEKAAHMQLAGIAQSIEGQADETQRQAMWNKFVAASPKIATTLQAYGIDPADHKAGAELLISEARGFQGPKSYTTVKAGESLVDPLSGKVAFSQPPAAPKPPAGYRETPEGSLAFIPGGPADPAIKPKGRDKFTEVQSKAANFANMMIKADAELQAKAPLGPDGKPGPVANPKNILGAARDGLIPLEGVRNMMRPDDTQAYEQAANQWIRAKLRKESGAAIGKDEMDKEFLTYFPQYWDGPATVAQKARSREEATRGMVAESSGAYGILFPQDAQGGAVSPPGGKPTVSSPAEAQQLIQAGKLKSGDHFTDENGIDRVVH